MYAADYNSQDAGINEQTTTEYDRDGEQIHQTTAYDFDADGITDQIIDVTTTNDSSRCH